MPANEDNFLDMDHEVQTFYRLLKPKQWIYKNATGILAGIAKR